MLTTDKEQRKQQPMATGLLDYFPDALAEVARVSFFGNQQHNPGQPLHWSRGKSSDHADCVIRHMADRGKLDDDGMRHSSKAAWRALANLQIELENEQAPITFRNIPIETIPRLDEMKFQGYPVELAWPASKGKAVPREQTRTVTYDEEFNLYQPVQRRHGYIVHDETAPVPDNIDQQTAKLDEHLTKMDSKAPVKDPLFGAASKPAGTPFGDMLLQLIYGLPFYMNVGIDLDEDPIDSQESARELDAQTLENAGCRGDVAKLVLGGTYYTHDANPVSAPYVYIAGPMRNLPEFNFPAFDEASGRFFQKGYNVISPAEIDRAAGIKEKDHTTGDASAFTQRDFVYRDFHALHLISYREGGSIAMLPGWEKSTGALAEFFLARWLGLKILDATTGGLLKAYDVTWDSVVDSAIKYLHQQEK